MKNFIQLNDLPGKDLATGKTPRYQRDLQAVFIKSDAKLITEARALLDDFLYNNSPLHDPQHPRHEAVKKAVRALEEELERLTCDLSPVVQTKPDKHTSMAKN